VIVIAGYSEQLEGKGKKKKTHLGSSENVLDSSRNLGTDAITLDQADSVVSLENGQSSHVFSVICTVTTSCIVRNK